MKKILLTLILSILLLACSKNSSKYKNKEQYDLFPMQEGNVWYYEYSFHDESYGFDRNGGGVFKWEITEIIERDSTISCSIISTINGMEYDYVYTEDKWDTTTIYDNQKITITEGTFKSNYGSERRLTFLNVPYPFKNFKYCLRYADEEEAPNGRYTPYFDNGSLVQVADTGIVSFSESKNGISVNYYYRAELTGFLKSEKSD